MLKIGGYAELAVAKASLTVPLPDGVDLFDMAGIAAQGVCAPTVASLDGTCSR
jgi:NADPH:quinone reductase-like Zn-dependent oxidoreductase